MNADQTGHLKGQNARQRVPNEHPTIGLLAYGPADPNNFPLWSGVDDATREQGANLICFAGNPLRSPRGFEAQANVLYDLVSAENVDGLVIWGGMLAHHVAAEEVRAFCERYRPLPMVSVGLPLEGIPSVVMDNYQAFRDSVVHLVEVHGCHRIAFIRGPEGHPEAEERYRAYSDVLTEHGIPVDPDLVAPGKFSQSSGSGAVGLLLDERKVDFEAVVAADDDTAIGALGALQTRGIRVPGDVAVVGFDDVPAARSITPPLTTAPFLPYEQGRRATEMVLALLRGEESPERVILPSKLIVRQSCGCLDSAVAQAAAGPVEVAREKLENALVARREDIVAGIVQDVGEPVEGLEPERAEQLLDAFVVEMKGESPGVFLSALDEVLQQVVATGSEVAVWQGVLSTLRRHLLPCVGSESLARAEDLWHQARVMIGETARRTQAHRALQVAQQAQALREIGQALITTFDIDELMDVLSQVLSRLDIPSAYLSLYEDSEAPATWARLILAYAEQSRIELGFDGLSFPPRQLAPEGMLLQERRYSLAVEPLYFRESQLGFALFEMGPRDGAVYEALRGEISSALKGALLLRERQQAEEALEEAYAEVEKKVQERTAELEREITGRERAQQESARLQQEVIEAQQRAIQELSTPIIPVTERVIIVPLIGSIDTHRARDITRRLLAGLREHRASVVILDITGVPIVDSGVAAHLNKTIQAAQLKGVRTIVTGISDAVAETIVDLGIDWSGIETLSDLRTGLRTALAWTGRRIVGRYG